MYCVIQVGGIIEYTYLVSSTAELSIAVSTQNGYAAFQTKDGITADSPVALNDLASQLPMSDIRKYNFSIVASLMMAGCDWALNLLLISSQLQRVSGPYSSRTIVMK